MSTIQQAINSEKPERQFPIQICSIRQHELRHPLERSSQLYFARQVAAALLPVECDEISRLGAVSNLEKFAIDTAANCSV